MLFWEFYHKSKTVINYYSKNNINEFSCNVDGDICEKVTNNKDNVETFLSLITQEIKI